MKTTQFILLPARGQMALAHLASTTLLSLHNAGARARLKGLKSPFHDFYGGIGLPVASGVSLDILGHISRRDVLLGVRAGDTFTSSASNPSVSDNYAKGTGFVAGVTVGISFDYDLFERAFTNVINRFRGGAATTFDASSDEGSRGGSDYDGGDYQ